MQFCATLEDNILRVQKVVANCTITNVVLGSVKVSNTLAFTGSDSAAAETARGEVATALARSDGSGSANYFGTSFGSVTVSDVKSTTTTNPQGMISGSMHIVAPATKHSWSTVFVLLLTNTYSHVALR